MSKNRFKPIREWAEARELYKSGDSKTQFLKLQEESGELARAILKRDDTEFYDAIGDCCVVLTNLVELYEKERWNEKEGRMMTGKPFSFNIEDCIDIAYETISKRTGKMVNGTFVKDEYKEAFNAKFDVCPDCEQVFCTCHD